MRIELPRKSERFGATMFYAPVQVYELDSGVVEPSESEHDAIVALTHDRIYDIQRDMAVVIPVRGERIRLIEGILFAIPSQCLVIVVSNSPREPVDRFQLERLSIGRFARLARKRVILIHQKDPVLGRAFIESGYPELVGEDGLVRDGKAEGMIMALVLARLAGKSYVGFVDADNYSPGAAYEYVREYAAGFALASSPYSMVRILWQSKPKIVDGRLFFARWGRVSRMTNDFLNALFSHYTGFGTDILSTGNAGEHALSMELALKLDYGTGYSVEPQHIVSLMEIFGGELECPYPDAMRQGVDVLQIESRGPHFHQTGPDDHVQEMARLALGSIYGSRLSPPSLRREIEEALTHHHVIEPGARVEVPRRYPPPDRLDFERFRRLVAEEIYLHGQGRERAPRSWSTPPKPRPGRRTRDDELPERNRHGSD